MLYKFDSDDGTAQEILFENLPKNRELSFVGWDHQMVREVNIAPFRLVTAASGITNA